MTVVNLTKEQYDRLPYKSTTVTKGRTYGEVIGLLEDYGIEDYRWTKWKGTDMLEFPLTVTRNDVEYPFMVKLTVPRLFYPKKAKGDRRRDAPKTNTYLEKTSWRIFHWYLKSRLEAISYGISDEITEFMYHVNYALPDGTELKLGEAILDNVNNLSKLSQLEDRREVDAEVVE
jgi:hypothetical protein